MSQNATSDQRLKLSLLFSYYFCIVISPLYGSIFTNPILSRPIHILALLFLCAALGTLVTTAFADSVSTVITATAERGDSVWDLLFLYSITYVPVVIATGTAVSVLLSGGASRAVVGIVHHLAATAVTVVLLLARHAGRLSYPGWIEPSEREDRSDVVLFVSVFLLTMVHLNSLFGPTGVLLFPVTTLVTFAVVALSRLEDGGSGASVVS